MIRSGGLPGRGGQSKVVRIRAEAQKPQQQGALRDREEGGLALAQHESTYGRCVAADTEVPRLWRFLGDHVRVCTSSSELPRSGLLEFHFSSPGAPPQEGIDTGQETSLGEGRGEEGRVREPPFSPSAAITEDIADLSPVFLALLPRHDGPWHRGGQGEPSSCLVPPRGPLCPSLAEQASLCFSLMRC